MNRYLVLKAAQNGCKSGRSAVVIDLDGKSKKSQYVKGNIPALYHGMIINMEISGDMVVNYELQMNERNISSLEKAGVNSEEYASVLQRHSILKKDGVFWNAARLGIEEIYNKLPFGEADKVHKEMLNCATEPTRVEAINKRIIDKARQRRKIAYGIEEYLSYFDSVEQEGAYQQLMVSVKLLCLKASKYGFSGGKVWDNEMKDKEAFISGNIEARKKAEYSLLTVKEIEEYLDTMQGSVLEKEQLSTVWVLKNSVPCIITGGAGTGKTTVIETLIQCYCEHYSKENVLLVAPTGRASRRLEKKTGLKASTIHKALRKNPEDDYTFYNDENPLPYRLIVVDESSMIDTSLMYDLLKAVQINSKIVFVGDLNQLYPVGYGEPFFDFMSCLDVYRLKVNHRQSEETDILDRANAVLEGQEITEGKGITINTIDYMQIGDIVLTNDSNTQILSPYNTLNAQINDYLKKGNERFNIGDKVMTVVNKKEYCNGDIGFVTDVDKKGNITVQMSESGKNIIITPANYDDLTLAYAITVHKMQGSEQKRIIMFIPYGDTLVEKRMMYTAITRAKEEMEIYYFNTEV